MTETIRERVLRLLRKCGPQDIEQVMDALNISHGQVTNAMSLIGIRSVKGKYKLPEVVPARQSNVFASPGLSAKYQISALGNRPGANDHLLLKSRFA